MRRIEIMDAMAELGEPSSADRIVEKAYSMYAPGAIPQKYTKSILYRLSDMGFVRKRLAPKDYGLTTRYVWELTPEGIKHLNDTKDRS